MAVLGLAKDIFSRKLSDKHSNPKKNLPQETYLMIKNVIFFLCLFFMCVQAPLRLFFFKNKFNTLHTHSCFHGGFSDTSETESRHHVCQTTYCTHTHTATIGKLFIVKKTGLTAMSLEDWESYIYA